MKDVICKYRGRLGISLNEAFCKKQVKCPSCGRVWRVASERGVGTLKYHVDGKTAWKSVCIPKHKCAVAARAVVGGVVAI